MRIFFLTALLISSVSAFAQPESCFVYYDGLAKRFLISKGSSFIWSKAESQSYGNLPEAIASLQNLQQQSLCKKAEQTNPFDCAIYHRQNGEAILRAKPTNDSTLSEYVVYFESPSANQINDFAIQLKNAGQCRQVLDLGIEGSGNPYVGHGRFFR